MNNLRIFTAAIAIVSLSACSSRPREFAPTLQAAPADTAKYEQDYLTCRTLVAQGKRSEFGSRAVSGGVGVAAGVGAVAMAGGGGASAVGALAAAYTAAMVLPVVGIAGAWGVAKRNKVKKEREVKAATALCLSEYGYEVEGWKVAKGQKRIKPTR
jgi:hypothetical protein